MKVCAIIPAGGLGKRMGSSSPKQFLHLGGIPVLMHTLGFFERASSVDRIIVVLPDRDIQSCKDMLEQGCSKLARIVPGGKERQDSVRNGLAALEDDIDLVVVHDAVRPFISDELINLTVAECIECGAVSVGMPVKDTIKLTDSQDRVKSTLERNNLWLTQTPQAFKRQILDEAYRQAYADGFLGTDDAVLVERIGYPVKMIPGSYKNIKITTPEDLAYGEFMLKGCVANMKVGIGYDSHRLAEGRPLILGGVTIPSERGLLGHSDADALIHAIIDALLGAMAEGDIGRHFPDSDPAYRGISSVTLLERVREMIDRKGYTVINIDASVLMERPKLAPHIPAMVETIARALDISASVVSVKAKTNEGMGFVGTGEGIAVMATATLSCKD